MPNYRIGMKVVCIYDQWGDGETGPVMDQVYKISGLSERPRYLRPGAGEVQFALQGMPDRYWHAHFRPAVEPSIEAFQAILARMPKAEFVS